MSASGMGHIEAMTLLLDRGADVDIKSSVSTCECTASEISLLFVCVCLVLLVYMLLSSFMYVLFFVL